MDIVSARYWAQKMREVYEKSHWCDQAGQIFGSENIPEMVRDLWRLGTTGEETNEFARKAQRLL